MASNTGDVTLLLQQMRQGNREAEEALIPLVYRELRRIAGWHLKQEAAGHTLQPTALVHEAYLKLARTDGIDWQGRSHFLAVSARLMRQILVDHARNQKAQKRGDGQRMLDIEDLAVAAPGKSPDILALDEALERLSKLDERQGRIVELRFFSGMTEEETGEVLGVSARTVKREWRMAKAWLYKELQHSAS
jgi:RNA polymerase sigma factor (TIGR02999 family)